MSDCMFTEEQFKATNDSLRKCLIQLCIDDNISLNEFSKRHHNYRVAINTPMKLIASSRNNLIKLLYSDATLTYTMFSMIVKNILGYNLIGHSMTFKHMDGTEKVISIDTTTF